jgi:hypothetical protein
MNMPIDVPATIVAVIRTVAVGRGIPRNRRYETVVLDVLEIDSPRRCPIEANGDGTVGWRGVPHSSCLHISREKIEFVVDVNEVVTHPIPPVEGYVAASTAPLAVEYTMHSQMSLKGTKTWKGCFLFLRITLPTSKQRLISSIWF